MIFVQREGAVGSVSFEGDAARVIRSDGSVIVDWTTGGVVRDIPQGDGYVLQVAKAGTIVSDDLAVGIVVLALGQSNMDGWFRPNQFVPEPASGVYDLDQNIYRTPGVAAIQFASTLRKELSDVPIGFVDAAIGGSVLLPQNAPAPGVWLSGEPGGVYDNAMKALGAVGGKAEISLWIQGESDAGRWTTSYDDYRAGFETFVGKLQADVPGTHMIIGGVGPLNYLDDDYLQIIRDAQADVAAEASDVRYVPTEVTSDLIDDAHLTDANAAWQAINIANAAADAIDGQTRSPLLTGSAADDVFQGTDVVDVFVGYDGNDVLSGAGGNDLLLGREGDDIVAGDDGADTLSGGAGDDIVTGGSGADEIFGDDGNDRLSGGTGADVVFAGRGDDVLFGEDGDDALDGGAGDDVMTGGVGNDIYSVGSIGDLVTEGQGEGDDLVEATVDYTLPDNVERLDILRSSATIGIGNEADNIITARSSNNYSLYGMGGNDQLNGGYGDDTLYGGVGRDILKGGYGADIMYGGDGDDVSYVDNLGDRVFESANEGTDWVYSTVDFVLSDNVENLSLAQSWGRKATGNDSDNILIAGYGTATLLGLGGNDSLTGSASNDTLDGGTGADLMVGGKGNDTYIVDNEGDVVVEDYGAGIDQVQASISYVLGADVDNLTLTGSAAQGTGNVRANTLIGNGLDNTLKGLDGDDTMKGGGGDDHLEGGVGSDLLYGEDGNDSLLGGDGADRLDGGKGADQMEGGLGNDTYYVDDGADLVSELAGQGTDTVISSASAFTLGANLEAMTLAAGAVQATGNELANRLTGNELANQLSGLAGNDTLDGGLGADLMIGGLGDDIYYVDNTGDRVIEAANEGKDLVMASVSVTLGDNIEQVTLTGSAAIDATGNALANILTGNSAANVLAGGAGNDSIIGGAGIDTAVYSGNFASYTINRATGKVSGASDGTDTLTGIETLKFANGTYDWATGVFARFNAPPTLMAGPQGGPLVEAGSGVPGTATATIALTKADVDAGDTVNFDTAGLTAAGWTAAGAGRLSRTGTYGSVVLDTATGVLSYTLDNARPATEALVGGATASDTFAVTVVDTVGASLTSTVAFTVTGTNDAAILSSAIVARSESDAASSLWASGNLTISDADSPSSFVPQTGVAGLYGNFSIDTAGAWTYSASSAHDEFGAGTLYADTFNVQSFDGTTTSVTINITGTNDAPTLTVGTQSGPLVEAGSGVPGAATATIALSLADVDLGDSAGFDTAALTAAGWTAAGAGRLSRTGTYGSVVLDTATGLLSYTLDNARPATEALVGGATASDTFAVTVTDAFEASVTTTAVFSVSGSNDGVTIIGTAANDTIWPSTTVAGQPKPTIYSDTLYGFGGYDWLDGGLGADTMFGGTGNDRYTVEDAGDTIVEAAEEGWDIVFSTITYTLADNVERLDLLGTTAIAATGNSLDNTLNGNSAANVLIGLGGKDLIDGGAGADTMIGGTDNDTYVVDAIGDVVTELFGEGNDLINASVSVTLSDNVERLTLTGTAAITGTGNALANTIVGNAAANALRGGLGNDVLTGGGGADMFVFDTAPNASQNVDRITDFTAGEDLLQLDRSVFASLAAGALQAASFVVGTRAVNAQQMIVYDKTGGKLFYDADGAGGSAQVQFATVAANVFLSAGDFQIV